MFSTIIRDLRIRLHQFIPAREHFIFISKFSKNQMSEKFSTLTLKVNSLIIKIGYISLGLGKRSFIGNPSAANITGKQLWRSAMATPGRATESASNSLFRI